MKKLLALLLITACKTGGGGNATLRADDEAPTCSARAPVGSVCLYPPGEVRPTQFSVGAREVAQKRAAFAKLPDDAARQAFLAANPAPAVIGPEAAFYVIDKHHQTRALLEEGVAVVPLKIVRDWSAKAPPDFWAAMFAERFVFPFDAQGNGPLEPAAFPVRLADLADDPYRSLAAAVTAKGGFKKTDVPFAEFLWAAFFRPRVALAEGDFDQAVEAAMKIVHDPAAAMLPGFIQH